MGLLNAFGYAMSPVGRFLLLLHVLFLSTAGAGLMSDSDSGE